MNIEEKMCTRYITFRTAKDFVNNVWINLRKLLMNFLLISLKMISPIETKDEIYDCYCLYLCFNQYGYEDYI